MGNYNLKLIKEFEIGEFKIPFLFSLDKIKAFQDQRPIIQYDHDRFSGKFVEDDLKFKIFEFFYVEGDILCSDNILNIDDFNSEWINQFFIRKDYELEDSNVRITSADMFYKFIHEIEEFDISTIGKILQFVNESCLLLQEDFINTLIQDIEYYMDDKLSGNNNTHFLQWALGETSTNSNPFFSENIGKATIDWSWREVEIRNIYKSKTFKLESAKKAEEYRIQKEAMDGINKPKKK